MVLELQFHVGIWLEQRCFLPMLMAKDADLGLKRGACLGEEAEIRKPNPFENDCQAGDHFPIRRRISIRKPTIPDDPRPRDCPQGS